MLLALLVLLVLFVAGCGPSNSAPPLHDRAPTASPAEEARAVTEPPSTAAARPTPALPERVHVVVFFDTSRGREHLDVQVLSDGASTTIAGVRADESRAHPVSQRVVLSAGERSEYARLLAALDEMPRCEPLAQAPREPTWRVESERYNDSGPSLWLRDNGAIMMSSTDPCLGYVRVAHFVYARWVEHIGL